jgi:hypothetical protein
VAGCALVEEDVSEHTEPARLAGDDPSTSATSPSLAAPGLTPSESGSPRRFCRRRSRRPRPSNRRRRPSTRTQRTLAPGGYARILRPRNRHEPALRSAPWAARRGRGQHRAGVDALRRPLLHPRRDAPLRPRRIDRDSRNVPGNEWADRLRRDRPEHPHDPDLAHGRQRHRRNADHEHDQRRLQRMPLRLGERPTAVRRQFRPREPQLHGPHLSHRYRRFGPTACRSAERANASLRGRRSGRCQDRRDAIPQQGQRRQRDHPHERQRDSPADAGAGRAPAGQLRADLLAER